MGFKTLFFGPHIFFNLGANAHGIKQVRFWKKYRGTQNASENQISAEPVNFLPAVKSGTP